MVLDSFIKYAGLKMLRVIIAFIVLQFTLISFNAQALTASQADEIETLAGTFVALLAKEDFSSATKMFDANMKKLVPADSLREMWGALSLGAGQYRKQTAYRKIKAGGFDVVFVSCEFEQATLNIRVVFDDMGKITGVFTSGLESTHKYSAPDYVKSDAYIEKEVSVGTGKWSLPGTLTLPRGNGPFPAVVLVHGSGSHDRDESVGPNKPFRDLAWGLASRGIAVLRYEKRKEFSVPEARFTVEEEVINDVLAAVSCLQNALEIDRKRIFVLGHSLGGMLAPRVAQKDRRIAGLIILAGSARPMEDIIYEQMEYLFSIDNKLTDDEQAQLKQLRTLVQRIKNMDIKQDAGTLPPTILGVPASYWLDLRDYEPAKEAAKLSIPILILQGGRDYQVTMADFEVWQASLSTRKNVAFKLFPSLNHLFMHGEEKSQPSEYDQPGHVHKSVIVSISDWIQ